MIIHLMAGQPLVILAHFHHALHLMRTGRWACSRTGHTAFGSWSCFRWPA
jgi:hypothetical protein